MGIIRKFAELTLSLGKYSLLLTSDNSKWGNHVVYWLICPLVDTGKPSFTANFLLELDGMSGTSSDE